MAAYAPLSNMNPPYDLSHTEEETTRPEQNIVPGFLYNPAENWPRGRYDWSMESPSISIESRRPAALAPWPDRGTVPSNHLYDEIFEFEGSPHYPILDHSLENEQAINPRPNVDSSSSKSSLEHGLFSGSDDPFSVPDVGNGLPVAHSMPARILERNQNTSQSSSGNGMSTAENQDLLKSSSGLESPSQAAGRRRRYHCEVERRYRENLNEQFAHLEGVLRCGQTGSEKSNAVLSNKAKRTKRLDILLQARRDIVDLRTQVHSLEDRLQELQRLAFPESCKYILSHS